MRLWVISCWLILLTLGYSTLTEYTNDQYIAHVALRTMALSTTMGSLGSMLGTSLKKQKLTLTCFAITILLDCIGLVIFELQKQDSAPDLIDGIFLLIGMLSFSSSVLFFIAQYFKHIQQTRLFRVGVAGGLNTF